MLPYENSSKDKSNYNTSKNTRDDVESMKDEGSHIVKNVLEQGQDTYDQVKSQSAHYVKMLEREVVAKPVQSVAIAAGAGLLLSLLLRRG